MAAVPPVPQPPASPGEEHPRQEVEQGAEAVAAVLAENGEGQEEELNSQDLLIDLQFVLDNFRECRGEDGQLYMDAYLRAYTELNKFFQILGKLFSFIAQDIQKKVTILQCYRKGGAGDYYYSIQSMIEYERENNLLTSTDQQSGSRTMLRLHRGLEFISGFFDEIQKASDTSGLGNAISDLYTRTLAKHHNWVMAKTVAAVLLLLPTKQTLMQRFTTVEAVRRRNEALIPKVIEVMNSVHNLTQKLYEDYDLLDLP